MSVAPSSTDLPALPDNLHNLKRPALLALCRIWNVKASGKNADLIYRLQSAAANRDTQDEDEDDSGEGSSQDSHSESDSDEQQEDADTTPETTVSLPRSPAFQAFQNLPAQSDQESPSRKRTREPSPHAEHETTRRGPLGALKSRSTMAAQFSDAPPLSPATQRQMKPLPRKSVLPGIKMAIQQTQGSPTRDDLAGGATTWTSSSSGTSSGLYPALPSNPNSPAPLSPTRATTVPQFTFTCSPTAPSPLPSPTRSPLPSSATSSVLAQLNARLAASGHAPATLHKSPSTQTLHHSASASSLLRAKTQEGGLSHSPSARFQAAHEQGWNKQAGIDSHWSMKRFKSQTNLKDADTPTVAEGSRATKKVKREEPASMVQEKASPVKSAAPSMAAKPPAPTSTSTIRPKARIVTGGRPSLLSSRKSKSRSSLSAGRIGRKSLIGSAGASGLPKKSSSLKPSKPSVSRPKFAQPSENKPSSSIPTATSTSPVRRFFAFGSATMKKKKEEDEVPSSKPSIKTSSAVHQQQQQSAPPSRPLSPSKQANTQASGNPANSQAANALRVAQARKKAAEESRRKMHLMKQQHHKTTTTSKGVIPPASTSVTGRVA